MRVKLVVTVFGVAAMATWLAVPAATQGRPHAGMTDWPLHSLDLSNSRYSKLDEINASNVSQLTLKWSLDAGANIGAVTPLVVNGVMYFHSGSKLFAVNAETGKSVWTTQVTPAFPGAGRGPAYGDGKIYAYGANGVYAVDAETGRMVESFGNRGMLAIVKNALDFKYPGKYAADMDPTALGYRPLTTPPTYYRGTLYVGLSHSDSHIPGGPMVAVDATTGAIKWVFNTIPQGPGDDGWEIAKDTWIGGAREGGGIWTPPAIDPELDLIYFNATNPSPSFDGSARKGLNLFTNAMVALNLQTGKLVWYYQTLHHDIWDWDLVSGPVLFDVAAGGRTIKGIGSPGKTCYLYMLDRATGKPINPIVETPVPTTTDVPGEQPWPTQPIPFTAKGVPQEPFCPTYPAVTDPELAKRVRPSYYPYQVSEFVITAPGNTGGANYGPPSFSPRTGLFYVSGKSDAYSIKIKPVGDTMRPAKVGDTQADRASAVAFHGTIAAVGPFGVTASTILTAYEPVSGRQVWYTELPRSTNAGNFVTAGDLLFQGIGDGNFYALDARSGKPLFKYTAKTGIRASPMTYQVNGQQFVSVVAGNTVLAFGLPAKAQGK